MPDMLERLSRDAGALTFGELIEGSSRISNRLH